MRTASAVLKNRAGVMKTGVKGRMSGDTMSGPCETVPQGASVTISCSNNGNEEPSWYD